MSNLCTAEGRSDMFGRTCHVDSCFVMSGWHGMAPLLGADCGWQLVPQSAGTWDFHHFDPGQDCRNLENLKTAWGETWASSWEPTGHTVEFSLTLVLYLWTDFSFDKDRSSPSATWCCDAHRALCGGPLLPSPFSPWCNAILLSSSFCWSSTCASYAGPGLQDDQWIPVKIKRSIIIMIYLFLLLAWLVLRVEGPQMVIMRPKHCCFCNSPWKTSRWFSYIRIPAW